MPSSRGSSQPKTKNPGIKPTSLLSSTLAGRFFTTSIPGETPGKPRMRLQMEEKERSEVIQSCLTLFNPMDCSLPGFSMHGNFQAKVLDWVAISFSRGSSRPRNQTRVSWIAGRRLTLWVTREAHGRENKAQRCRIGVCSTVNGLEATAQPSPPALPSLARMSAAGWLCFPRAGVWLGPLCECGCGEREPSFVLVAAEHLRRGVVQAHTEKRSGQALWPDGWPLARLIFLSISFLGCMLLFPMVIWGL